MLTSIRPRRLFYDNPIVDRMISLEIPDSSHELSLRLLEHAVLIYLARVISAEKILEIGTNIGVTSLALARNVNACIHTWDIVRNKHVWEGDRDIDRASLRIIFRIREEESTPSKFDLIFIDGSHTFEDVRRDTEYAFQCSPKIVVWHDVYAPSEPDVTKYLETREEQIYHVEDTFLAFWSRKPIVREVKANA